MSNCSRCRVGSCRSLADQQVTLFFTKPNTLLIQHSLWMPALFHKEEGKWTCNSYGENHKDGHNIVQFDRQLLPVVGVRGEPQVEGELLVLSPDNTDISHFLQPATSQAVLSIARPTQSVNNGVTYTEKQRCYPSTVEGPVVTLCTASLTFSKSTFWSHSVCMCFCGSENKQLLFPYTALTDWFL